MRKKRGTDILFKALLITMLVLFIVCCFSVVKIISDSIIHLSSTHFVASLAMIIICIVIAVGLIVGALMVNDIIKDIRKILKK